MKRWLIRIGLMLLIAALILGGLYYRKMRSMGFYRTPVFETQAPQLPPLSQPALLVFSKTNSFIHVEAIPAAQTLLQSIAAKQHWSIFLTDNGAIHNAADLRKFNAVVWNNVTGDVLTEEQREALRHYIESGGGFIALHGAGDASVGKSWPWYNEVLIGAQFIGHPLNPQFQTATVVVEDRQDPITRDLPARWSRSDEWYSFARSPRAAGIQILATLDENSYSPKAFGKDLRMGADHPIMWKHCVGVGRVFYSALGHTAESYAEPAYENVLMHALAWAAGLEGNSCGSAATSK